MKAARKLIEALLAVPVFVKVMGIALGVSVMLGAGMLWQIHQTWHEAALNSLADRGRSIAVDLALHGGVLLREGAPAAIQPWLEQTLAASKDVAFFQLLNARGQTLVSVRVTNSPTAVREARVSLGGELSRELRVGMSEAGVTGEVAWLTRRLARITAMIGLLGMLAAWWLTRIFAGPLQELVRITHAVKEGDYRGRVRIRAGDEVGELATSINEMIDALEQKDRIQKKLLGDLMAAEEDERQRVARELHDHTGQALTSMIAALGALESGNAGSDAGRRLADLRRLAEQTLTEVHDLSRALRPAALDDHGLVPALQKHCELVGNRAGVAIRLSAVEMADGDRLAPDLEVAVYRVVQEALTNAIRHGRPSRVQVLLERKAGQLLVAIEDDGCGFDGRDWRSRFAGTGHLGLLGIEERIRLLGGSFCVESRPGAGTQLFLEIPFSEGSRGEDPRSDCR